MKPTAHTQQVLDELQKLLALLERGQDVSLVIGFGSGSNHNVTLYGDVKECSFILVSALGSLQEVVNAGRKGEVMAHFSPEQSDQMN